MIHLLLLVDLSTYLLTESQLSVVACIHSFINIVGDEIIEAILNRIEQNIISGGSTETILNELKRNPTLKNSNEEVLQNLIEIEKSFKLNAQNEKYRIQEMATIVEFEQAHVDYLANIKENINDLNLYENERKEDERHLFFKNLRKCNIIC